MLHLILHLTLIKHTLCSLLYISNFSFYLRFFFFTLGCLIDRIYFSLKDSTLKDLGSWVEQGCKAREVMRRLNASSFVWVETGFYRRTDTFLFAESFGSNCAGWENGMSLVLPNNQVPVRGGGDVACTNWISSLSNILALRHY